MFLLEYGFKDTIYYSKGLDDEIPSHNANKLDNARKTLEGLFYKHPYAPEIEIKLLPKPNDFALGQHRYFYY